MLLWITMRLRTGQFHEDDKPNGYILSEQAVKGNRGAFEQLVQEYREDIFRMVYVRTQSKMDAEDLTQEIFMKAFNNISRLEEPCLFKAWLYRIAVNHVRDHHRRRMLTAFFFLTPGKADEDGIDMHPSNDASSLDYVMKKQFWDNLSVFLAKLGRFEKEVFQLKYLDHLSIPEISTVLNKNENTIKTHLYRAVKKFRLETALVSLAEGAGNRNA
jgi:RNA polymerase sigma-70 factor, ECF subfamily